MEIQENTTTENTTSQKKNTTANGNKNGSFDYSKAEPTVKNIIIPNSQFCAKWEAEKGYAVGIENYQLTKHHETLEGALNEIGYGVDKDKEGEEILVKVGDIDFELITRIIKTLLIINKENNG